MRRSWIIPFLLLFFLLSVIFSRPDKADHDNSPAFDAALRRSIWRLEGTFIRSTIAATPVNQQPQGYEPTVDENTCEPTCDDVSCDWTSCQETCNSGTYCGYTCDITSCWASTCAGVTCDMTCEGPTLCDLTCEGQPQCGSPPQLSPVGDRELNGGEQLIIQLEATDEDEGDVLIFSTDADAVLPSAFSFSENTGLFVWQTATSDAGVYDVTFEVTDGTLSDSETIAISVYYPHSNLPPVLEPIDKIIERENKNVVIIARASDPNDDALIYSINDPRFIQNDSVFTWQTDVGDAGTYFPVVSVSDGYLSDSVTVEVVVVPPLPEDAGHDPLYANISEYYAWSENQIIWNQEHDGYISGNSLSSWRAAIVSERVYTSSDSVSMTCRIDHTGNANYMFGFTQTAPPETDFHYSNINLGVYIHSSGSLRPTWDVHNGGHWGTTLPEGVYDCRISLNTTNGIVSFEIEEVENIDDPLSEFSSPFWVAHESRTIEDEYHAQINPFNPNAVVYDVWSTGSGSEVATLLQGFALYHRGDHILVTWTLSEYDEGTRFSLFRVNGETGSGKILPAFDILRDDLTFSYIDRTCEPGTSYFYRVYLHDTWGERLLFETDVVSIPELRLTLYQNYPNPFNPTTSIRFYLPHKEHVRLDIFDVSGQRIAGLIDEMRGRGVHVVEWDGNDKNGNDVASGVYFYRIIVGKEQLSRKMLLLR